MVISVDKIQYGIIIIPCFFHVITLQLISHGNCRFIKIGSVVSKNKDFNLYEMPYGVSALKVSKLSGMTFNLFKTVLVIQALTPWSGLE